MSFQATFTDLRTRRRIPMRLFEERVGINPSYIHGIEKQGLLPTPEKLELLASVFVEVASEQEAAAPEEDARRLFKAREKSLMEERLGLEPGVADIVLAVQGLTQDQREDVVDPLKGSIAFFGTLRTQERRALGRLINEVVTTVGPLAGAERTKAITALAAVAEKALKDFARTQAQIEPPPDRGGKMHSLPSGHAATARVKA